MIGGYQNGAPVYVVHGGKSLSNINLASMTASQGFTLSSSSSSSNYGSALAVGDINGEGLDDIVIGAPLYNSNIGQVYVVFGSHALTSLNVDSMSSSVGYILSKPSGSNCYTGSSLAVGDVNNDGYGDVIAGANGCNSNSGTTFVVYGSANPSSTSFSSLTSSTGMTLLGYSSGEFVGIAVSSGDINSDGYDEIIIGADNYNTNYGRVFVVFGNTTSHLSTVALSTMTSNQGIVLTNTQYSGAFVGCSVASSDINNDGYDDIIIAGYGWSGLVTMGGIMYVVYGGKNPTSVTLGINHASTGFQIQGTDSSGYLGFSVAAGDINGDGYQDVLMGANNYNSGAGKVVVVYAASSGYFVSAHPSSQPSSRPTMQPSELPTVQPSEHPTFMPTKKPSEQPSSQPTRAPSRQPSLKPSKSPSCRPSLQPSTQPSMQPTCQPIARPSRQPSGQPSVKPSIPTSHPSSRPSSQPTAKLYHSFSYTGGVQYYTVPKKVNAIYVDMVGASSGSGGSGTPGYGARVTTTIYVTPGDQLYIYVGGQGAGYVSSMQNNGLYTAGGFNGGGNSK